MGGQAPAKDPGLPMAIEFDPAKSEQNEALRGLPFSLAERFDWATALVGRSAQTQSEPRHVAIGEIDQRTYVIVFTIRGENVRVISLRRANRREVARYAEAKRTEG